MEMSDKPIIDKRYLEIAIVSVSALTNVIIVGASCTKLDI